MALTPTVGRGREAPRSPTGSRGRTICERTRQDIGGSRHQIFSQVPVAIEFFARLIRTDEDVLFSRRPVPLVSRDRSNQLAARCLGARSGSLRSRLMASGCAVIYSQLRAPWQA